MIASKHITKIILALMAAAVFVCCFCVGYASELTKLLGGTGVTMEYETALFDTDEIITVDIQMDESEWEKMLSNAISEEYYVCNVVVNGRGERYRFLKMSLTAAFQYFDKSCF